MFGKTNCRKSDGTNLDLSPRGLNAESPERLILEIEISRDRERWRAQIPALPDCTSEASSRFEAVALVQSLARRVLAPLFASDKGDPTLFFVTLAG